MWTIKTVDTKLNLQSKIPGERLMMHVTAVLTNGTDDVTIPFVIENKELMDRTLLSIVARMNQAEADVAITPNGEAYEVEVPKAPEPVEPTAEEKAAMEAQAAWVDAYQKLEKAKKLRQLAIDSGREVNPERQAEIDALAEFVDFNFKNEYIDLV
jgi:hypothetical protein